MIGIRTPIGQRLHRARFENTGAPVPDGKGGYAAGAPEVIAELFVDIQPARGSDQERFAPGTVTAHGAYLVSAPYVAGLTTATRMVYNGRVFSVMGVSNRDERNVELTLMCDELLP